VFNHGANYLHYSHGRLRSIDARLPVCSLDPWLGMIRKDLLHNCVIAVTRLDQQDALHVSILEVERPPKATQL
jgi:hypothetical protein